MSVARQQPALSADGALVTKSVLRAAARLGMTNRVLSRVLGVSEATVSRMGTGAFALSPGDKAFEVGLLFVRLFRSLDAIVSGDDSAARGWMTSENAALGGTPLVLVQTLGGLVNVVAYLDARRALV